jgi:hypothetical protein
VKSWADNAATPNLLAYIFAKDCSTMSTRLCFDGAWQRIAHDDARDLKLLKEHCPQLIESIGPTALALRMRISSQRNRVIGALLAWELYTSR